jgi:NADPH:quinone reductase-like Zn-dependent oxidoreductase
MGSSKNNSLNSHEKEVVISNHATGLNPIDYKSVDYNFGLPQFPWVTGREMAGKVEAAGPEVTDLKVGDHVWASTFTINSNSKI